MNTDAVPTSRSTALSPLVICCLGSTWLVWGSTYLVIRFALAGFAPYFMMATRFFAAGGLLLAWQLARGARLPTLREWGNALLIGTLMLCGGMGGVAYAEQTIASGLVVSFIAVMPLLLVIVNLPFGVYPRRTELLAVGVGLSGVVMLTQGAGLHASPAGLLAISLGVSGWTLGSVLSQRGFALTPGPTGFATEMLCGGVSLLAVSAIRGESWILPTAAGPWISWSYLVVFGSLVAFSAYMVLLERTTPSLAASYSLVNPVVALILGVTFGAEHVSAWEWFAAAVVMSGIGILFIGRRR